MLTKALLTALVAALVVAVSPAKADGGNERIREPYAAVSIYCEFMTDKPAPKNADASLVAWGRKFTKGKPPA